MNRDKKRTIHSGIALVALAAGLGSAPAVQAQFVQENDWQIHLENAVAGLGNITGIDNLNFAGAFQSTNVLQQGASGSFTVGDINQVDIVGNITACNGTAGNCTTTTGATIVSDFELTFFSRLRNTVVQTLGVVVDSHNDPALNQGSGAPHIAGAGDTVLELYVDTTLNAIPATADPGSGGGMAGPVRDPANDPTAILIATFELIQPGDAVPAVNPDFCDTPGSAGSGACDGTTFNVTDLNGDANSTYRLTGDPFGVFFRSDGTTPLPLQLTLAETGTDTNVDPDNNGVIDTTVDNGPFGGNCGTTIDFNCGEIDGSLVAATQIIPEPGALGMLGLGLAGFAFFARRRRIRPVS